MSAPLHSSHYRLWLAAAELDLEKEIFSADQVKSYFLPLDMLEYALPDLQVQFMPGSKQAVVLVLSVWFFQEVNGIMYLLRTHNLSPVKVLYAGSSL